MNKKLVTLAVAAALIAPAAAMADAVLYGKMNVSLDYMDINQGLEGWGMDLQGFDQWAQYRNLLGITMPGHSSSRSNRFGVKGSEDLGGGLKAIYQIEIGVNATNESDNNIVNGDPGSMYMRNTFVGLAGGFGTFLMGRHDTPMKVSTGPLDLFADTIADMNRTVGFQDLRADNAVAYISPSFSGFTFAGAVVPGGAATGLGNYENLESDSIAEGYSLAGIYSNGPFYGTVSYESLAADLLVLQTSPAVSTVTVTSAPTTFPVSYRVRTTPATLGKTDQSFNKWRAALGILNWNGFTLDGIYENDSGADGVADADIWQIQAAYAFGNFALKGMYGEYDADSDAIFNDQTSWALGADYNFSKRTKAYLVYSDTDLKLTASSNAGDWSGFSLGMMHSF